MESLAVAAVFTAGIAIVLPALEPHREDGRIMEDEVRPALGPGVGFNRGWRVQQSQ